MQPIPVAILGATGMVGQRMVEALVHHPFFRVTALTGSERHLGIDMLAGPFGIAPHVPRRTGEAGHRPGGVGRSRGDEWLVDHPGLVVVRNAIGTTIDESSRDRPGVRSQVAGRQPGAQWHRQAVRRLRGEELEATRMMHPGAFKTRVMEQ